MTFASKLAAHRARIKCSIATIAGLCDISTGTAWNWEHGIGAPALGYQPTILRKLAATKRKDVPQSNGRGRPRKVVAK